MKKLKAGLIGADPDLRAQLVWNNLPDDLAELTAVADRNPEILQKCKERFPGKNIFYTASTEELLNQDIDAVFIIVRDQYHEELAIQALNAGKAVYLEKPMAITLEGCDRILETAYKTGQKLFLGHNMRYMERFTKMKEIIDSGVIGQIQTVWVRHFVNYGSCYFHHWCSEQKNCTGLLLQKGAHDIDIIHWLAGAYSKRVSAMGRLSVYNRTVNRRAEDEKPDRKIAFTSDAWPPLEQKKLSPVIDVEDSSMIMMTLENGVQACYLQCMYSPDQDRNYTFIGDKGRVECLNTEKGEQIRVWYNRCGTPDIVYNLHPAAGGHGGADPRIVRSFVKFVQGTEVPAITPIDARNAVAAGFLGHYSMRNGSIPCEIPPVPSYLKTYFEKGQTR